MNFLSVRKAILVVILIFLSGFIGYTAGTYHVTASWQAFRPNVSVESKEPPSQLTTVDFSLFWEVWDRTIRTYYDKKVINAEKMMYGAISGMLQSLGDPYTVFLTPTQNTETKQELRGEFEGIGAQLGLKDKRIVVIAPLSGTPAEKAGIKAGDTILKIDGKETSGMTLPDAVQRIRGQRGTQVTLSILHEGSTEPVDISIVRGTITVKSVEHWVKKVSEVEGVKGLEAKGDTVAYIRLSQFGDNTTSEWLTAVGAVKEASSKEGFAGLILDLRNNPGGYLNGAVFIGSEFLEDGTVVMQERANGDRQMYPVERRGALTKIPLVVLINKGSASASEIVAGALRDRKSTKLIGETSFGKGTVQEAQDLPGSAGLHITTARWLTPKGTWVNDVGLTPDVEVVIDKEDATHDVQLEKAIIELIQ